MRLLLSEILPLRTTRDLGNYEVNEYLPWRFGELEWFTLLKISPTMYFVADHPATVTSVRIGRVETDGWERQLVSDGLGRTWTVVVFAEAVPDGESVSAKGTGYRNPTTGELVQNPADVVEVVESMAGRDSDWSALRAECSKDGITVAGSLDAAKTVQAWIHEITGSVGAIWGQDVRRLYPISTPSELIWRLESNRVDNLVVTADAQETADILRVGYDWSSADDRPTHSITVKASPMRFDGKVMELDLKWLRKARAAEVVSSRLLSRLACRRYNVTFLTDETGIRPGHWVLLESHPQWPFDEGDPYVMVTSCTPNLHTRSNVIVGEVMYSTPTIEVDSYSLAIDSTIAGPLGVEFKNGIVTFTVRDDQDPPAPLPGALVALDGSTPKATNLQGRVSFPAQRGDHVLIIEHPLFETQRVTLSL